MRLTTGLLHWAMPLEHRRPRVAVQQPSAVAMGTNIPHTARPVLFGQPRHGAGALMDSKPCAATVGSCGVKSWPRGCLLLFMKRCPCPKACRCTPPSMPGRTTTPRPRRRLPALGHGRGPSGLPPRSMTPIPLQWDVFVGKPLARPDGFTTATAHRGLCLAG